MNEDQVRLTRGQVRHFAELLRLAAYDCKLQKQDTIRYFIDADVAVRVVAGFEGGESEIGTVRERLFRALLACEQVGCFRLVLPHAMEVSDYIERKQLHDTLDQTYNERADRHIESSGIREFLGKLSALHTRYREADLNDRREHVVSFIDLLRRAGEDKFPSIEAIRGPWTRRLRLFYSHVLRLDSLGPEMRDLQEEDLDADRAILQFLENRRSDRSVGSNYRDARALAILARATRTRIKEGEGPLVRFYSETPVVRAACEPTSELGKLFDEREGLRSQPPAVDYGMFRSADYFLIRVQFPEVGFARESTSENIDDLLNGLEEIGATNLRGADVARAIEELDRRLGPRLDGQSLASAIRNFQELRSVRAIWARDLLANETFAQLQDWVQVSEFARNKVTRNVLEERLDDIQANLRERVSGLHDWFDAFKRIRSSIEGSPARHSRERGHAILQTILDDPSRALGLDRWGVVLDDDDLTFTKELIRALHDTNAVAWHEAFRSFSSEVQRALESAHSAKVVCAVLWMVGDYHWMCEVLDALASNLVGGKSVNIGLLLWREAAWIRGTADLEGLTASQAVQVCRARVNPLEERIDTSPAPAPQVLLLKLGLAYVLYHCWKRLVSGDREDEPELQQQREQWVDRSLELAEEARRGLPQNTLRWGLAVNHCAYVAMEAGSRDAKSIRLYIRELMRLKTYDMWTARFADTAACYHMWLFEREFLRSDRDTANLRSCLEKATDHLRFARDNSVGDIAVEEHEARLDELQEQYREV